MNGARAMASRRRCLIIIASFIVCWEVFFLLVANHHIASNLPQDQLFFIGLRGAVSSQRHYKPDYTKFNTSHPPILYASSPGSLPSLPGLNSVPRNVLEAQNFTEHYSRWDPKKGDPHTLFVYNPSIVSLFPSTSSSAAEQQTLFDEGVQYVAKVASSILHSKNENAQYLATFRVSSIHSCGFPTYEFWNHPVDYVGLALLTDKLKVARLGNAESLDIIVDINAHLSRIYKGRRRIKFQDVRLFALGDKVFMSSGEYLVPVCVEIRGNEEVDGVDTVKDIMAKPSPAFCNDEDNSTLEELPALYRGNDRLHLFVTGDAIRLKDATGKNFQFFYAGNASKYTKDVSENGSKLGVQTTNQSLLMEYWPMGPRLIHDLGNSIAKIYSKRSGREHKKRVVDLGKKREMQSEVAPDPKSGVAKSLDSSLKTFIKRDRSSACCVRIESKHYADILPNLSPSSASEIKKLGSFFLGISHSKSRARMPSSQGDRYNYLSRVYAFADSEPYNLIARSGLLCLGFPNENDSMSIDDMGVSNEYNKLTKRKKLELYGETYDCPNIHFVDSIIDKADDDSRVIVSYGVNDCVPSFVEVHKHDLVLHLFSE